MNFVGHDTGRSKAIRGPAAKTHLAAVLHGLRLVPATRGGTIMNLLIRAWPARAAGLLWPEARRQRWRLKDDTMKPKTNIESAPARMSAKNPEPQWLHNTESAPPQSCADLPQHLTFDGEPSYTDERE